jgi:hypothetical protein
LRDAQTARAHWNIGSAMEVWLGFAGCDQSAVDRFEKFIAFYFICPMIRFIGT